VRMSKRTGDMITLKEVIDEIGVDATRFFMAMTDETTHLDFDLELAKSKSDENPVYYVQYAYARICSIKNEAGIQGVALNSQSKVDLSRLKHSAERDLVFKIAILPDEIEKAALMRAPHHITNYSRELATLFHTFYHQCRVINLDDLALTYARLSLVEATRITLKNVLKLLKINTPERM